MSRKLPPAIFIMGPTASGKTDLALQLADKLPCDIISVDSALIFKGMDIGTAKPSPQTLSKYPHQLVDILDPTQSYSAADFRKDALRAMEQSTYQNRIPVLVGGTMLYYKTLLEGLATLPSADPVIRAELEQIAKTEGYESLHEKLKKIDPQAAQRIHPNDPQRIIRALEVYLITDITLTVHHENQRKQRQHDLPYTISQFAIAPSTRSILHERIEKRFHAMLELGFIEEVEKLRSRKDITEKLPSMRAVGYRQAWNYLNGILDYNQMQEQAVAATRQLAKRQFTWLRSWEEIQWLDSLASKNLSKLLASL